MQRVLVTGANGQLGKSLQKVVANSQPNVDFIFLGKSEVDITNFDQVLSSFQKYQPTILINASAYTAVDRAEEEQEKATKVNVTGVSNLLKACAKYKTKILHISTDYVFDGTKKKPYLEMDFPCAINHYGKTKQKAEELVLQSNAEFVIVRTSWVFSEFSPNFVTTISRLAKEKEELNVVVDQMGRPTFATDLAMILLKIIRTFPRKNQLYHFANVGECSWYELAKEIVKLTNANCKVKPIETDEYPTLVERPKYSVLDTSKIEMDFQIQIPHWKDSLKECIFMAENKE